MLDTRPSPPATKRGVRRLKKTEGVIARRRGRGCTAWRLLPTSGRGRGRCRDGSDSVVSVVLGSPARVGVGSLCNLGRARERLRLADDVRSSNGAVRRERRAGGSGGHGGRGGGPLGRRWRMRHERLPFALRVQHRLRLVRAHALRRRRRHLPARHAVRLAHVDVSLTWLPACTVRADISEDRC
jgi:hypothetical protein